MVAIVQFIVAQYGLRHTACAYYLVVYFLKTYGKCWESVVNIV